VKNSEYTKLAAGLTAVGMSLIASGAWAANPALPGLQNQNFTQFSGSAPKGPFSQVDPVGWTGGTGLIYIDSPTAPNSAAGPIAITTYANPVGNIPGNYVEADGNPFYESGFNYSVSGLTVGQTYTLSFYQGASQQVGFVGDTTNQWIVSLATGGLQVNIDNQGIATYSSADPTASIAASPLMQVPTGTAVGWQFVSVDLTADATTDLLSFLAWGNNGSTVNLPPMAFLSGVDAPPGLVPEPSTWAMMILGFVGLGYMGRRQMKKKRAVTTA
jgi:hypothetical protein